MKFNYDGDPIFNAILKDLDIRNGILMDAWVVYKNEKWHPVIIKDRSSGVSGFEVNYSGKWGTNIDVGRRKLKLEILIDALSSNSIPTGASIRCKRIDDSQLNGRHILDLDFSSRLRDLLTIVHTIDTKQEKIGKE